MLNDNEIRRFQCSKCNKFRPMLKKVADRQHHGFACDQCWIAIVKRARYNQCSVQ